MDDLGYDLQDSDIEILEIWITHREFLSILSGCRAIAPTEYESLLAQFKIDDRGCSYIRPTDRHVDWLSLKGPEGNQ